MEPLNALGCCRKPKFFPLKGLLAIAAVLFLMTTTKLGFAATCNVHLNPGQCVCHNISGGSGEICPSGSGQVNGHDAHLASYCCSFANPLDAPLFCNFQGQAGSSAPFLSCSCQNVNTHDLFGKCNGCGNGFVDNEPNCCDPNFQDCSNSTNLCEKCDDGNNTAGDGCSADCQKECTGGCNDGNTCTTDSCNAATGLCKNIPTPGTSCNDNNLCTDSDLCQSNGSCAGTTKTCSPLDECHIAGTCNPVDGNCSNPNKPDGSTCADNDHCDGEENCQSGVCQPGSPIDCDDGEECTADSCDQSGNCQHPPVPENSNCDDTNICTVNDHCSAEGTCASDPKNCDDGNVCTDDTCDSQADCDPLEDPNCGCVHNDNEATCDDGNACTDNDQCSDGGCEGSPKNCDDDNVCNGAETCDPAIGCVPGTPLVCGDGIFTPECGEECDDGNQSNTDNCTNDCHNHRCGDGFVQGTEQCDDGNTSNTDSCTNACTTAKCGDGFVQGDEQCDDANQVDTDTCTNACTTARCGDSIVGPGEACDDGNDIQGDGCENDCTSPACGNGIVDSGEQCDSGESNSDSTPDACRSNCTTAHCGDGIKDANEVCDDGNEIEGDGCENNCTSSFCGNGIVDDGEQCDGENGCGEGSICDLGTCACCPDANHDNECDSCVVDEDCNNDNICDGSESCVLGSCQNGPALTCDDGNACTADSCNPETGCEHDAIANCPAQEPCTDADNNGVCDDQEVGGQGGGTSILCLTGEGGGGTAGDGTSCNGCSLHRNPNATAWSPLGLALILSVGFLPKLRRFSRKTFQQKE